MKSWLAAHRYAARRALARYARRPLAALFESGVLGIALALPLAFVLVVENVRSFAARHPATPEMSIFLALDAAPAEIEQVAERLHRIEGADVRFISRVEASKRLRQSAALADVLDALPDNPLPDAFTLRLAALDTRRLDELRREVAGWPRVARVQVDSDWAQKLDALVRAGWLAAVGLGGLLGLAMLAVTFNTVRLQMLQQQEEIELSRLIGATDAFLRRPYLYFGALQGFFGAAIALSLIAAVHALVSQEFANLSITYGTMLELQPLPWASAGSVLGVGAALGCAAAWLCATRAARARELRR
ncbi:MAG: cell division protein FtsX [Burkholderiales bacterium]